MVASVPAQGTPRTWSTLVQQAARTAGTQPEDRGVVCTFKSRPSVPQKSLTEPPGKPQRPTVEGQPGVGD